MNPLINMTYKTYIDESGNTGSNLIDKNQKFFTLAAVSIPQSKEAYLLNEIQMAFDSVKESDETEIKTAKWVKAPSKYAVLQNILKKMQSVRCDISVVFIEKRYMVAALIAQNFLDGAYNDIEDYTWCSNKEECMKAAQYFYEVLKDEDIELIAPAFTLSTLESVKKAIKIVIDRTTDIRYLTMLKGCQIEKLFKYDLDSVNNDKNVGRNVSRSPNYTAFCTLGNMVAHYCSSNGYKTDILFDSCMLCNDAYKYIYDLLKNMGPNPFFPSWKGSIIDFNVADSKSSFLLQTADVVATSILKSLEKVFNDDKLTIYDDFMIKFIYSLYQNNGFYYVMNESLINKLILVLRKILYP